MELFSKDLNIKIQSLNGDESDAVQYGKYSWIIEQGISEVLEALQFGKEKRKAAKMDFFIGKLRIKYILPLKPNSKLIVKTIVSEILNKEVSFKTEICNTEDDLFTSASCTISFMEKKSKVVLNIPTEIKQLLNSIAKV